MSLTVLQLSISPIQKRYRNSSYGSLILHYNFNHIRFQSDLNFFRNNFFEQWQILLMQRQEKKK